MKLTIPIRKAQIGCVETNVLLLPRENRALAERNVSYKNRN